MTIPAGLLSPVPSLVDRVEFLFELARRRLAMNDAVRHPALPASLLSEGAARSLELATSPGSADGLVHGDLHPANVLRAHGRRGLVAIDPRACRGDRHFDLVDWVLSPDVEDRAALDRRLVDLEAAIPGVHGDRLRLWAVALASLVALPLLQRRRADLAVS
jgi:streptomycin 6-kinase